MKGIDLSELSTDDWIRIYENLDADEHLSILGQEQLEILRGQKR